jgi:cysteinyl-tRNA synthetase
MAGVRVDVKSDKKNPVDFALWKRAEPEHIMRWKSPWGEGYPGWHLECSSMSTKYLGQTFDIHGGGLENMFPHHECEIAQSEAANDKPFARYWLHNNMVTVDGVKMGKSLGNFLTVKDALKQYPAMAIRFFILSSHYRSPIDFSNEALQAADRGYDKIIQNLKRLTKVQIEEIEDTDELDSIISNYQDKFNEAMNDDFNSPKAIAAFFDFFRDMNIFLDKSSDRISPKHFETVMKTLNKTLGDVLGLMPADLESLATDTGDIVDDVMSILLDLRARLRVAKNYELADSIRDRLNEINIEIKDTPKGSSWERK